MVDLFIFYEFIRSKKRPVHMDAGANILRQGTKPQDLSQFMLVERTNIQILVLKPSAPRFSTVLRSSIALRFLSVLRGAIFDMLFMAKLILNNFRAAVRQLPGIDYPNHVSSAAYHGDGGRWRLRCQSPTDILRNA